MKPRHLLAALLVAAIWGLNFTIIHIGLRGMPPLVLAGLRFVIAALPCLILPRPRVSWPRFLGIGITLFVGQYGFLFVAMARGLPPGLASVALQLQAFLTILFAALLLRERPTPRQVAGGLVAFAGLAVIATTSGGDGVTAFGMWLCLASAICFAMGNVLLRGAGRVDMLAMIVWLSLIPPLPLFALSLWLDGPTAGIDALASISWSGVGAVAYIGVLSTVVGFALWGHLLKLYPAATVAPFALLVPVFGAASAWALVGERFGPMRLAGMALVLAGLGVVVVRVRRPAWLSLQEVRS